jgi:hypothetical protein
VSDRPPPPSDEGDGLTAALVGAVVRPMPTLAGVAIAEWWLPSLVAVLAAGGSWAAFCVALHGDGHAPSFTGVPIPAAQYYLAQALFIAPLLLVGWVLLAAGGHGAARTLGGQGTFRGTLAALGLGYGLPILLVFVLPDILVYAAGGFAELGFVVRLSAPLCALWVTVMSAAGIRAAHELSWGRASAAALAGVVLQGLLVGTLAR